jgi:ABC-type transport system involved in multi-copper enzyme maturation permease subunit
MSATVEQPSAPSTQPAEPRAGFGGLLRSELHRFRSRRFIQVVLVLALVGWLVATAIALTHFGNPGADELARAEQRVEQDIADNEQFRQECLANPGDLPPDLDPEDVCPPSMTREDIDLSFYLDRPPFDFADAAMAGALGFAVISAVLAGLIGATWIGAEWSSRSLVALLFWVPQRMRVMGTKIAVLVGASLLLGVVAQAGWLAMSGILRVAAGNGEALPAGLWGALLQTQARAVLLTVLAGLLAFGLTNLVRNTGAALGIGFVYLVIAESAVRALRPRWQPWLLSDNAAALVQDGGLTIFFYDGIPDSTGFVEPDEYFLGHLQSGIYLAIVAAVIVALGAVLFARRDIH